MRLSFCFLFERQIVLKLVTLRKYTVLAPNHQFGDVKLRNNLYHWLFQYLIHYSTAVSQCLEHCFFGVFIEGYGPFLNSSHNSYATILGILVRNYHQIFGTFFHKYVSTFSTFIRHFTSSSRSLGYDGSTFLHVPPE